MDWKRIQTAGRSEVGRVREVNQDASAAFESGGERLFVVADGMGGHRGGEVASAMAVEAIGEGWRGSDPPGARLRAAIEVANRRIFERAAREAELAGMGTTVVALLLAAEGDAWVAHVGDSRLYRWRGGELGALTQDHSLVGELERHGYLTAEEAALHPRRNELTRSVGTLASVEVDVAPVSVAPGDRLLLCSDGLCGYVDPASIARAMQEASPEQAVRTLVELADASGGLDNVTVRVVWLLD